MQTVFKILWKHKDFPARSEGPILRHSRTGTTTIGPYYTKRFADKICRKFNDNGKKYKIKNNKGKFVKLPVVQHWVREVLVS